MESYQKPLLAALSEALFGQKTEYELQDESYQEAVQQAVLPLLMSVAPNSSYQKENGAILANSIRSFYEHGELHEIMTEAHIPYVVLKGAVLASYYSNPVLRSMGDVDFFVYTDDIARAGVVLEQNEFIHENLGYLVYDDAYSRDDSVWELHWGISGTPDTKIDEVIQRYLGDLIENAVLVDGESGGFYAPSDFHHCLLLLLHSVHHMMGGGIGLRHLCDWAVFANKVNVNQWEKELKECGVYQIARVLTLVSIRYLGMPYQNWCAAKIAILIHPSSYISPKAVIKEGTVILPKAVVNANSVVNRGCIINLGAIVDHGCIIEAGCHICLGAIVKGENRIKRLTKIEAGEVIEARKYKI